MISFLQSHKRSILFLLVILVGAGVASTFKLPVGLFPRVSFPRVVVSIDAGDRPAERMAIEVTWPVEEAVRSVPGVRVVRSLTSRGSAEVSADFAWGEDMEVRLLQVESAVNRVLPSLPQGTTFEARRMNPTVDPVIAYSLTSRTHSLVELRDLGLYQLRPLLSTVQGVAKVEVLGGDQEEYRVTLDPGRLTAYGMSPAQVADKLAASNVLTAVGRLEDHDKLYLAMTDTRLRGAEDIRNTVLRSGPRGVVLLSDVATVSRSTAPRWTRVNADGRRAVIIQVYQQLGGNTVEIARQIKQKLAAYRSHLPAGVNVANWYDQSDLIVASAGSVRDAVLIGAALAAFILVLFLRDLRITLIAIIAVPSVLAVTVLLLYVLHMTFNIMTLGGLAAAVGLIIDDTIVMVEHIVRRMRDDPLEEVGELTAFRAARELTHALAGSSASTIVVFAPLAFLGGVTGAFFKPLSLTMASSLIISFFVAWLVVPLLSDWLLSTKDALEETTEGRVGGWVRRSYERVLGAVLANPWVLLPLVLLLAAGAFVSYRQLGSGFMPHMDEGGFILDYISPPGTSLSETNRLLLQVEAILRATPEVETYSRRTGLQLGGGLTEANEGDCFIRLKPFPRRPIEEVMDDVRRRVEHRVPGLEIEEAQLMEDLIGDLTAVPQPIEIKLFSDDDALLMKLAPRVADAIGKVPGVVDVNDGVILAGDALELRIDRVKAALEGVDPDDVTQMVKDQLDGVVTTQVQRGPKMVGVRVWIPAADRRSEHDILALRLRAPDGHVFTLRQIARLERVVGQPQIAREDLKQMVAVTGRIAGRDMGSTIAQLKRVVAREVPGKVRVEWGGLYHQQQIAFTGLMVVFATAVLLVFFLLLFLYERFRVALSLLLTTLLASLAVLIGLRITGTELNISSMMGITMVVGIVTEVGIFYVSELYELPADLPRREALILAGVNRARPIAMTTLAAILALMPLALAIGQGAAMQQPLAIAIISGLTVQLPLVLVVLPALLEIGGTTARHHKSPGPSSGEGPA